jgi:hypothetical protein
MKNWEKIFDLDFENGYFARPRKQKAIQATFWELKLEEVVSVDYFTAR